MHVQDWEAAIINGMSSGILDFGAKKKALLSRWISRKEVRKLMLMPGLTWDVLFDVKSISHTKLTAYKVRHAQMRDDKNSCDCMGYNIRSK